ncbi:Glyoxylase, beta-lactamase superfamily II [Muriicola jejuensis]|uniref:MBL fold metallo-hydrolase n=1 Tax=Muriicola jejuensis TaxID=504488 RepID=A0A6P0UCW9_9FLAO|nr:MBL fold metallo-hydrolase [Muriicola jejuensis]NER09498.1 MBL fold metallo-hydrolase [Muriicola jejuensis]SMP08088.1 Glyoxylase, beta-lactamase superfamily II [Muriicola jejuensis]
MKHFSSFIALTMLGLLPFTSPAQDQEVTITIDTLSPQVYMLTGQGGNIGIYEGAEYVFMIDDQFSRLSEKIKAAIARISDKPLAFLFNTHMHGDHTGGNASFNEVGTTVVAHDNVRNRVMEREKASLEEGKIDAEYYQRMLPELTFSDQITFFDKDETILGFHVHEAHTDGDALVYFSWNNVLHMGDTYFAGRYPYIDLGSGGSVDGLIETQKRALMLIDDQTRIIPGHGRPSNKQELTEYISMLEHLKARVLDAIESGASLEEVMSDPEIGAPYDATYGSGFISPERIRETIYKSLSKN